jgi:hypothetical protein
MKGKNNITLTTALSAKKNQTIRSSSKSAAKKDFPQ